MEDEYRRDRSHPLTGSAEARCVRASEVSWKHSLPLTISEAVEHGDAIGFGPKAHHACLRECRILDRKQRFAIEDHVEARSLNLDAQRVPLVGGHGGLHAVPTLAADNVQRAASPV